MDNTRTVLAVILARGGSKGIPRKNLYPVDGHPLLSYSIAAALDSRYIDRLIVSTEDPEIAAAAQDYGADVPFVRPADLAADTTLSVDALHHAALAAEAHYGTRFDYIVELPCVAPLRDRDDIDGALGKLFDTGADSVISVVDTGEKHPVRLKRIVDDRIVDFCSEYPEPIRGSRRQDLEPCYIRNGAIYAMTRHCLIEQVSRHGRDSRPYIMPEVRSVNIDSQMDLLVAQMLVERGMCRNRPKRRARCTPVVHRNPGRPRVLVTAPLHFLPEVEALARERWECVLAAGADRDQVQALLPDVDAWMCSPCPEYRIDADLLGRAPRLRVLGTPSTGTNHLDLEHCAARSMVVVSLRGSEAVNEITASSEFTFALLIAALRKLPFAAEAARRGVWREREDEFRGAELRGLVLGIIGFGRIGSNLAKYARAFGMQIVAFDPHVTIREPAVRQAASAAEVLQACDALAVCVHLDESTRGMVDARWFAQMRDGAVFINTSRGDIVDEAALLDALKQGKLAAAAVDVIQGEQSAEKADSAVLRYAREHPNLIVTPHIAGLTYQSERKAALFVLEAIGQALGAHEA